MGGVYQFDDYMTGARDALGEGDADTAMDWVNQALSLAKHLEDSAIAQAYKLKAEILIAEEEYSDAEEALQKALDVLPRNVEWHLLLGELMLLDGRHQKAASAFELAVEIAPEQARARSLLIFCYGEIGKYDLARECFERCVELGTELAESYYHMGICFFRQGKPEAREFFQDALSQNPVLSGPHYYLGRMKLREGDFASAESELGKELELNPANSLAELELIRSYLLRVGWQDAVEVLERHFPPAVFCEIPALKGCRFHFNYELLDEKFRSFIQAVKRELPQTPENLFHLAKMYRFKSLFGEAVEHLKKVLEDNRRFRPAYGELAELYTIKDELGRACEVLEEAAAVFEDAESCCELGRGLLSSERYAEAEEAVRRAVSLSPEHAEAHYLMGAILTDRAARATGSKDLMEQARECLLKALEIDPGHAAARAHLMYVAFQSQRYDESLALAEKVLKENPEDRLALLYSGRCFHDKGDFARAEERLVRLTKLYPDDGPSRGALAEVYRAEGKFKEAAEELEQAIAVPGMRPLPEFLFRLGEIYLLDLGEPVKARERLVRFLQTAPPGHPDFDRAKELLETIG